MKTLLSFSLAGAAVLATRAALAVNTLPPPPPPPATSQPAPKPAPSSSPSPSPSTSPSTESASTSTFNQGPDPLGEGVPSFGAFLGFGTDNLNLGLGVRGGYTLPQKVYLGGAVTYHFGTSNTIPVPGGTVTESVHVYYLMFEGGYDITAGPVVVRPMAGLGPAWASASVSSSGPNVVTPAGYGASSTDFAFMLAGAVFYPIPDSNFAIGGEARILIVNNYNSFGIFATGAYHF
jgi:hypothetical protein